MSENQEQEKKAQEHQAQYNKYQELLAELRSQLSSITIQLQEHQLVDKTLSQIPPTERSERKCFKMIGGVLVEKKVDEVILILDQELKELTKTKEALEKETEATKKDLGEWMVKNKVKIVRK